MNSDEHNSDESKSAQGEHDLDVLMRSMQPELIAGVYVFATVENNYDYAVLKPQMVFQEKEGISLILEKEIALEAGLAFEFPCRMITLNVHSSLEAVGFLARITNKLAALNMGVNPVSGFYHDHLFVPEHRAEDALSALKS